MAQSSKWNIDLAGLDSSNSPNCKDLLLTLYATRIQKAHKQIESKQQDESTVASAANADMDNLKLKKAWDAALAPAKNIPMNAFMLWMSGNSVQIFSILMTAMLLFNSAKATVAVSSVFQKFAITPRAPHKPSTPIAQLAADPLLPAKLTYIIMQLACLGLGVWKCGKMGLLPTAQSDWLAFMGRKEVSFFGKGG
ncbi:hypothetical protein HK097_006741 [Rhizophlyctis rosea]|uniref:ER membrane protein complex subunit 4 n=1 Tax=Rhizophlyctis rosea TaxID=64517 RepID=A0AAD5SDX9_9FUNG|nr:hypothetical protein HK097_006741 [Rhizophlyctis rosea]